MMSMKKPSSGIYFIPEDIHIYLCSVLVANYPCGFYQSFWKHKNDVLLVVLCHLCLNFLVIFQ
jgi:hypothetical protein